jgi:hypothetical protein
MIIKPKKWKKGGRNVSQAPALPWARDLYAQG